MSKTCRTEASDGEAEIRAIKKIKKFTAYFYSALFVNWDHLEKAEVHDLHPWCAQVSRAAVSESPGSGKGEGSGIDAHPKTH
jgi:hypothetical protein